MRPIQYTITAVDRATQIIDRISERIERLSQPFSRLGRSVQRLGDLTGVNKLAKGVSWLTTKMMSLLGIVLKLGAPLLALFGGGSLMGIYQMTERWSQLGFAVSTTSQIIGISAQKLMNWRGVGDLVGIGAETMTKGLQGFQQTLQDAKWGRNQAVFGMLKMLNIDLKQTKDGVVDTEAVLYELADRIQKVQKKDPAAAQKLADMFGVSELLPVLMNGGKVIKSYQAEVEKLQGEVTPAMTERASKFAEKLNAMKAASDGMKVSIADKLIPVFQPLIEKWTNFLTLNRENVSDKIAKLAERLANWLDEIDFEETLKGINNFIDGCVDIVKWTGKTVDKFKEWESFFGAVGKSFEIAVLGKFKILYSVVTWTYDKLKQIIDLANKVRVNIPDFPGSKVLKRGLDVLGLNFGGSDATEKNTSPTDKLPPTIVRSNRGVTGTTAEIEKMTSKTHGSLSFDRFKKSIIAQESGHKYWEVNKRTGALGLAQIMPQNLTGWGKNAGKKNHGWDFEALGYDITPKQFISNPELQMKIIDYKLKQVFDKYGPERGARVWYSNNPNPSDKKPAPNEPSPNEYSNKILERMQSPQQNESSQDYLKNLFGKSEDKGKSNQPASMNVLVNTVVHPTGATTTRVETPQGVKISHNQPGNGYLA
ncbi:hypothetical protein [Acinetobacter sp. Ac_5812]|uniref:hypothetical protein n=1 Tax=Acinetobacter sp. Ac_5812 TaxID=1848937 RepID=UPI00148F6457|nr:hypothetical protein [Acinetobacter sp. Ac_5812]NNP68964.1 hypothetical protein [Acinetobacter sp. Ac_5812]